MRIIDGKTRLYGVMGGNVGRSLSPIIHNAAMQSMGINALYMAFSVLDLEGAVAGIRSLDIRGVSVTIPFKETIIPFLDGLDEDSRRIGAVNTLFWNGSALWGGNTDWLGAISALKEKMEISKKRFLVIGAGGAGRAIVFGLKEGGGEVFLTNRTGERGKEVARVFQVDWVPWEKRDEVLPDCIINATPLGMNASKERWEMPTGPDALREGMIVMDIVTDPLTTPWLKEASSKGCITIEGSSMLLHQAAFQFERWFNLTAPIDEMRRAMKEYTELNLLRRS